MLTHELTPNIESPVYGFHALNANETHTHLDFPFARIPARILWA